jgi:hypothetical protein
MKGPNPLGPILISVLKLGSNVTKGVSQTKMVSVIEEKREREGRRLQQHFHIFDN